MHAIFSAFIKALHAIHAYQRTIVCGLAGVTVGVVAYAPDAALTIALLTAAQTVLAEVA